MADTETGARGFGGRNRLRNLSDTSGSAPKPPAGDNANPNAGSYGPKEISAAAHIPAQDTLANAGSTAGAGAGVGHKIETQRAMLPKPDDKGASSRSQGPEGDFGGAPGQTSQHPSISYP